MGRKDNCNDPAVASPHMIYIVDFVENRPRIVQ
ncbi:type IV pilus secretin protein PilU [Solemya velum gill symbiont]|uniref:Type IV pilus secretin protein PilU n=1 Tax=Solemya velum gill symbiont TaxID=2340 RepID=A0A0B0HFC5_SOVGS|nr:type IV pilus secretin protein PilU [Solemya velum gill symbiont]